MTTFAYSITKRERDCLVSIRTSRNEGFPMKLHEIAEHMGIKPPTALNVVRRLKDKGFVDAKEGMIQLTEAGENEARMILMVHRTMESLLYQSGVPAESACEEAGEIDFIIPALDAEKILRRIDSPSACPHGKAIKEA